MAVSKKKGHLAAKREARRAATPLSANKGAGTPATSRVEPKATTRHYITKLERRGLQLLEAEHRQRMEYARIEHERRMEVIEAYAASRTPSILACLAQMTDEDHRKACYAAVYESDHWKTEIAPKFAGVLKRETIQVTRLVPTALSPGSR